jgi:hypothetical protein
MAKPFFKILLIICALFVFQIAQAQSGAGASLPIQAADAATPEGAGFFAGLAKSFNSLTSWIVNSVLGNFAATVKTASLAMANSTNKIALILAAALAVASLVWKVLIDMLQKKSVMGSAIEVIIYATITVALLTNYSVVVDQIWNLAAALLSSLAPDGTSAIGVYVATFWDALSRVFTQISNEWSKVGVWRGTVMIVDAIGALLIMIGVIFMMVKSLADIIGIFVMGPVYFGIGVVFGPVMIATFVADYTRAWFNKWFEFLIGSAMLTVVASVVLILISAIVRGSVDMIGIGGNSALMSMIGVAIMSLSFSTLFQSVPAITDALFPGRTGASGSISSGMGGGLLAGAVTGMAGAKMALELAKAGPGQIAATGAAVANATIAGLNAKTNLTNALNGAGDSIKSAAKIVTNGISSFGDQARSSDAGKALEGMATGAAQSGTRAAETLTGDAKSSSPVSPAGSLGPGMSKGQINNVQSSFNSNFGGSGGKKP